MPLPVTQIGMQDCGGFMSVQIGDQTAYISKAMLAERNAAILRDSPEDRQFLADLAELDMDFLTWDPPSEGYLPN